VVPPTESLKCLAKKLKKYGAPTVEKSHQLINTIVNKEDILFDSLPAEKQSFLKLQTCRGTSGQNFQEPAQNVYF
jgi:hypothetical protein